MPVAAPVEVCANSTTCLALKSFDRVTVVVLHQLCTAAGNRNRFGRRTNCDFERHVGHLIGAHFYFINGQGLEARRLDRQCIVGRKQVGGIRIPPLAD